MKTQAKHGFTLQEVSDKIKLLTNNEFYGKLVLNMENGKITSVKKEEIFKPNAIRPF